MRRLDAALFTHPHTDHIMGFDDMRRFCEMEDRKMPIYANRGTMDQLHSAFRYAFDEPQPWRNYLRLDPHVIEGPFSLGETSIMPVELPHGKINVTGYVLSRGGRKLLAYFTDCSGITDKSVEEARGVEVLVLDALRDAPHPTHMNFDQAMAASQLLNPGSTYFIHLCHDVTHARKQSSLPTGYFLAYDGLQVSVGQS